MTAVLTGLGLKMRFGLNRLTGYEVVSPVKLYNDALNYNQVRIDKIRNLNNEIPTALSDHKDEVVRIFDEVQAKAGTGDFAGASRQFDSELLPALNLAEPEADEHIRKRTEYDSQRPPVEVLLANLKAHAQHAHVAGEIAEAERELTEAAADCTNGNLDDALTGVANAKNFCEEGKDYADQFAAYVVKRAAAGVVVQAMKGLFADEAKWQEKFDKLTAADGKVTPPKHEYATAEAEAEGVLTNLKATLQRWYVDEPKPKIKALKDKVAGKKEAAKLIEPEVTQIDTLQAEVEANLTAEKWSRAIFTASGQVGTLLTRGHKLADRRLAYDAQRTLAVNAIDGLKSHKTLLGQMFSMNKLVEKADGLASREQLRVEDGIGELKNIVANCTSLLKVAADAEAYNTERAAADQQLATLQKHAAAGNIANSLAAIQRQLATADKLTGDVESVGGHKIVSDHDAGSQDWKAGRNVVAQAMSELTAAEALAASLAKATEAQAAAGNAQGADAINAAIAELRKQAEAAAKRPHADLATHEFTHITASLDEATDQAASGQLEIAKIPLQGAAELLLTAQTVQAQHVRFVAQHQLINDRVVALNALRDPDPAKILAKITAVSTALTEAANHDQARAWDKSAAALHKAADAATEAELVAQLRKEFDARSAGLEVRRTGLGDNTLKGNVATTLTDAASQATAFRFDLAAKKLDLAEAQIESATVSGLANSNPDDPKFLAAAKKMLKAEGGEKLLDQLVKSLPTTVKAYNAMVKLAKERFGIELKSDADYMVASGQKMWEMLAKVPQQSINNPSLKKVERREPGKNGGFYRSSEDLVVMNGRPGRSTQKFGANLKNARNQDQLPGDVGEIYKPDNDAELDYFDFATLHEVGHAVDDRLNFMASRMGKPEFGGWQSYGGNIDPIAAAVGKMSGFYSKPEQKQYVADKILGLNPTAPTPPSGEEVDWQAKQKKVDDWYAVATNEKLWWSQPDTDLVTIDGVVYHEAYKRTWVSYPATERKKGMTGYQFRAPGEWFAELYACYHSKKLKKGHPAAKWLSSLSL